MECRLANLFSSLGMQVLDVCGKTKPRLATLQTSQLMSLAYTPRTLCAKLCCRHFPLECLSARPWKYGGEVVELLFYGFLVVLVFCGDGQRNTALIKVGSLVGFCTKGSPRPLKTVNGRMYAAAMVANSSRKPSAVCATLAPSSRSSCQCCDHGSMTARRWSRLHYQHASKYLATTATTRSIRSL